MGRLKSAILGIPRTIWFNLKYLPLRQALKFPVVLAPNVRIRKICNGAFRLTGDIKTAMIRIGFHTVEPIDTFGIHTIINVDKGGILCFNGSSHIGRGAILHVAGGSLTLGNNFAVSGTTSIICKNSITIGDNVQFSYGGLVNDSDAHTIIDTDGNELPNTSPIMISDKVWIAPNVTILKGASIPSCNIVASNSLINKKFTQSKMLIGGIPAKELKPIADWKL